MIVQLLCGAYWVPPALQAHGISDLWQPDGRGPTQVLQSVRHREDEELALRASAAVATQHASPPLLNVTEAEECVTNYAIVVGLVVEEFEEVAVVLRVVLRQVLTKAARLAEPGGLRRRTERQDFV